MTAAWMSGALLASILLALAAAALERVVALFRDAPLRWIWAGAGIMCVAVMSFRAFPHAEAVTPKPQPVQAVQAVQVAAQAAAAGSEAAGSETAHALGAVASAGRRLANVELPAVEPATARTLLAAWGATSAFFALLLVSAAWRLRRERRSWPRDHLAGTAILRSPSFGPAIVGVLRPAIVVPHWVAELDEQSRRAIVLHEAEHLRAHDPALLFAGLLTVVLFPWNIGLWLCWRGLRRSVELDCDARVLSGGMSRTEYANVLLGAWQRARSGWLPSPAFAERTSGLGRRVEHLMRPEPRRRAMRTFIGVTVAGTLALLACVTPAGQQRANSMNTVSSLNAGRPANVAIAAGGTRTTSPVSAARQPSRPYPLVIVDGVKRPDLPPRWRYTGVVRAETTSTPTYRITYDGPKVVDTAVDRLYPARTEIAETQFIAAPASELHFGQQARYGALLYYTKKYRAAGGALLFPGEGNRSAPAAPPGTPASEMAQRIYDRMFNGISLPAGRRVEALAIIGKDQAAHDALKGAPMLAFWPRHLTLLAERDVALRALLANDAERAAFDVHAAEQPHAAVTAESVADNMFTNLFVYDTLALSKGAALKAHAIIERALVEEVAHWERAPGDFDGRIAIRIKRDAALRSLLTSDRDRAKFNVRAEKTMKGELRWP